MQRASNKRQLWVERLFSRTCPDLACRPIVRGVARQLTKHDDEVTLGETVLQPLDAILPAQSPLRRHQMSRAVFLSLRQHASTDDAAIGLPDSIGHPLPADCTPVNPAVALQPLCTDTKSHTWASSTGRWYPVPILVSRPCWLAACRWLPGVCDCGSYRRLHESQLDAWLPIPHASSPRCYSTIWIPS
jgi:hypothetical protein